MLSTKKIPCLEKGRESSVISIGHRLLTQGGGGVGGDLAVVGNRLCITIPEKWLSEAKYPVIVDPTIGTTTVGSQTHWDDIHNEEYNQLFFEVAMAVNRFLLPETLNGTATAFVYAYEADVEGPCKPILYSDNNNVPLTRRSVNEGEFDIAIAGGKPAGWRSTTFNTNTSIASGNYVWFGLFCLYFAPRFDYGAKCYWDLLIDIEDGIPNTYPLWSASWYYDFRVSMYFTYTSAQNYTRVLTQGVTLSDNRNLAGNYKRRATQTVQANISINGLKTIYRKIQNFLQGLDAILYSAHYTRLTHDIATVTNPLRHVGTFFRGLVEKADITGEAKAGWAFFTKITDTVHTAGAVFRGVIFLVRIITGAFVRDYLLSRFLKAKGEITLKSCVGREIVLESKIN
jgi:hypothetical protein